MVETAARLREWLAAAEPEMVRLVERLARAESPSLVPESQQGPFALLAAELEEADFAARALAGVEVGDHLYAAPRARRRGAPYQLLLGHMDTVWPLGTLAEMPVRREDGRLFGPGVIDMKGGLATLVYALRALRALDLVPSVTPVVLVNSDEEIGSPDSERLIRLLARGAARAFVLECAEGREGRLKIARKGVGRFTLTVHGRSAHAGTSFEEGISAIQELSTQVQRLFALNDTAAGVTVNVGTIDGGLRANVVAARASCVVGVRAPSAETERRLEAAIRGLEPTLPGARLEVEGGFGRPPMEPLRRNRALLQTAVRLGRRLGLELADAGLVGGSSDANTTSLYTATLDGLGPRGDGSHAADEHVVTASLPERAALLALLLLEPATVPGDTVARRRHAPARVAIVGTEANSTNSDLVAAWQRLGFDARLSPAAAVREGEIVLGRLDVLPTLDGIEAGLLELLLLERRGAHVLNRAAALLCVHDKLRTAHALRRAGLPHPRTAHLRPGERTPPLQPPLVLKPRFGSWGADVYRCQTSAELGDCLELVRTRPWFRRHGALLQQLVPEPAHDLRLLLAAGRVIGAIERIPRPGEWRTNISLGATHRTIQPPPDASRLALAAAAAAGIDLAGVDFLPLEHGYTIVELNGAVDFDPYYTLLDENVFEAVAATLTPVATAAGTRRGRERRARLPG